MKIFILNKIIILLDFMLYSIYLYFILKINDELQTNETLKIFAVNKCV